MVQKRWKRKSGYVTPNLTISKKELLQNNLFMNKMYDDWSDWRDGMRDWFRDFKLIKGVLPQQRKYAGDIVEKRLRMNEKQTRLLQRRTARKSKLSCVA